LERKLSRRHITNGTVDITRQRRGKQREWGVHLFRGPDKDAPTCTVHCCTAGGGSNLAPLMPKSLPASKLDPSGKSPALPCFCSVHYPTTRRTNLRSKQAGGTLGVALACRAACLRPRSPQTWRQFAPRQRRESVCACACEKEREREKGRERKREKKGEEERERAARENTRFTSCGSSCRRCSKRSLKRSAPLAARMTPLTGGVGVIVNRRS